MIEGIILVDPYGYIKAFFPEFLHSHIKEKSTLKACRADMFAGENTVYYV